MQDDQYLAALLSRNLTFGNQNFTYPPPEIIIEQPQQPQQPEPTPEPAPSKPIIYSVSQHYNHSAHIARSQTQPASAAAEIPRSVSEPPQTQHPTPEYLLAHSGIDPTTLSPAQQQLFRACDDAAQQQQLVELWRICPPATLAENPSLAWSTTSLEQEVQLARLRYERVVNQQHGGMMSLDDTPIQDEDGRWALDGSAYSEPYMADGYAAGSSASVVSASPPRDACYGLSSSLGSGYSPATDPVYQRPDQIRQREYGHLSCQRGGYAGDCYMDAMET